MTNFFFSPFLEKLCFLEDGGEVSAKVEKCKGPRRRGGRAHGATPGEPGAPRLLPRRPSRKIGSDYVGI